MLPDEELATSIGMVMYPEMDPLDLVGPYEVLARVPNTRLHLLADTMAPVTTALGLSMNPNAAFARAPVIDVLFVPGGPGQRQMSENLRFLTFVRKHGKAAKLVTSVCTGSLLLGAAGLLQGYRATTHWLCLDELSLFGAYPRSQRVVIDRNRMTAAGVSAGIDLALVIAAELRGEEAAQEIQLLIEYDPKPPFDSGSPRTAPLHIVKKLHAGYRKPRLVSK